MPTQAQHTYHGRLLNMRNVIILDSDNVVSGVSSLGERVDLPSNYHVVDEYDARLIGKRYDASSKSFSDVGVSPIRSISTGAMQRRFTIVEESAVEVGSDVTAKVIRSRLLNADFCDLDFADTQEGLAYIVNYLAGVPNPYNQDEMLVTNPSARLDELLADGQQSEAP